MANIRIGDLIELSSRLSNHAGRVVRVKYVEADWEDGDRFHWYTYLDPDGHVGEDGKVLQWRVRDHLVIKLREQRPDYAEQDREMRERDRLRRQADEALRMSLQRLGLVRVPRHTGSADSELPRTGKRV